MWFVCGVCVCVVCVCVCVCGVCVCVWCERESVSAKRKIADKDPC